MLLKRPTFAPLLSRRSLLGGIAAQAGLAPFATWLLSGAAHAQTRRVRPEINSTDGQRMAEVYRTAVQRMSDRARFPQNHPHNWTFQANVHMVPPGTRPDTIFRPSRAQTAAQVAQFRAMALGADSPVWNTCPHHTPHFLPWHRLYLAYFEEIVAKVAGQPFALPYWNYIDPQNRQLPEPFRAERIAGRTNALFFRERTRDFLRDGLTADAVAGLRPADVRTRADARIDEIMGQGNLFPTPRRDGFNALLEGDLHDQIHGAIGTGRGMGNPQFAALDPIFWLHHCTIDWLWESWRQPGPDGSSTRDPRTAWTDMRYAFVDAEVRHLTNMDPRRALRAPALGFRYDQLFPVQGTPVGAGPGDEGGAPTRVADSPTSGGGTIRGAGDSARLPLRSTVDPGVARGLADQPSTRWSLDLRVRAKSEPGVYRVFAVNAAGAEQALGSFSLFAVEGAHAGHGGQSAGGTVDVVRSIDVTHLVRAKVLDPASPGAIVVRPSYLQDQVSVTVLSADIIAK
jgi:tyrosinase